MNTPVFSKLKRLILAQAPKWVRLLCTKLGINLDTERRVARSNVRLLDLPTEVILNIIEHLPDAYITILALVSTRIRAIILYHLDLPPMDTRTRIKIALILQRDHVNLMACRSCGRLFRWRWEGRQSRRYDCPGLEYVRSRPHLHLDQPLSYAMVQPCKGFTCGSMRPQVTRDKVDLMLRSAIIGPEAGLPVDTLNRNCSHQHPGRNGVDIQARYHVIDGELIFAGRYSIEIKLPRRPIADAPAISDWIATQIDGLEHAPCAHILPAFRESISSVLYWQQHGGHSSSHAFGSKRCSRCATEARFALHRISRGPRRLRLVGHVWRNLGGLCPDEMDVENLWTGSSYRIPSSFRRAESLERRYARSMERESWRLALEFTAQLAQHPALAFSA